MGRLTDLQPIEVSDLTDAELSAIVRDAPNVARAREGEEIYGLGVEVVGMVGEALLLRRIDRDDAREAIGKTFDFTAELIGISVNLEDARLDALKVEAQRNLDFRLANFPDTVGEVGVG